MDAPEDRDLWVQRNSSELLDELLECIPKLIYQRSRPGFSSRPRTSLSGAALSHITRLLDLFQEWPQLLDSKLNDLVHPLNDAFLEALRAARGNYGSLHRQSEQKFCLPQAIAIIVYSLCKVRSSKVIVRFLSNEARYLEPILNALETWTRAAKNKVEDNAPVRWEERYILLLWISHLLLTPFDLQTVGSDVQAEGTHSITIEGLQLPDGLPLVSRRILSIAVDNISSASKERESAILTIVRLGLRPDMRRFGLHEVLIYWATSQLRVLKKAQKESGYAFIGLLSFLAALVKSADTPVIGPFLLHIFNSVEQLGVLQSGSSSALTRKAVVKIYSACSIVALSLETQPDETLRSAGYILEPVIDELLTALGDVDTTVRQSASKALSVIATKLDPAMAADISEIVIKSLEENVIWETQQPRHDVPDTPYNSTKQRNLSLVNPSKWQGLVLTLSQLLFRRCPPVVQLPEILNCLILALSFEQRSSTGASLGTNVRDAACFGIWAIARRYSTAELLATNTSLIVSAGDSNETMTVIQLLAIQLLVTATIDPAGNIRRGASAALQELIGRHPDTVSHGIPLVQVVDYHAVALRSRAMREVAVSAARLDARYQAAIELELMGWRGIGATDVESRRVAAETLGRLSLFNDLQGLQTTGQRLWRNLDALDGRTVQKRQGFLLSVSALVRVARQVSQSNQLQAKELVFGYWEIFSTDGFLTEGELTSHTARPELINEAAASLIYELATASRDWDKHHTPSDAILQTCFKYLGHALDRRESIVLQHATKALKALFEIGGNDNQQTWLQQSINRARQQESTSAGVNPGHLLALSSIQTSTALDHVAKEEILQQLVAASGPKLDIDTRVVALQGLTKVISGGSRKAALHDAVVETIQLGLKDYTTDQRGDVGSLLRLEAINAVMAAFDQEALQAARDGPLLLQTICVLAGEKLDKVRIKAWLCLEKCWNFGLARTVRGTFPSYVLLSETQMPDPTAEATDFRGHYASVIYYRNLSALLRYESLKEVVLQGLFGSTGAGSESVLVASRQALAEWLQDEADDTDLESFGLCIETIINDSLDNDRVLLPTLESLGFVLQTNTFTGRNSGLLRWRKIFVLVQKAHFKTKNISKLLAAVEIYGSLGAKDAIRSEVLKKLTVLLAHPFPKVRNAAADTLFLLTHEGSLRPTDWGDSTKFTKKALSIVKESLGVAG